MLFPGCSHTIEKLLRLQTGSLSKLPSQRGCKTACAKCCETILIQQRTPRLIKEEETELRSFRKTVNLSTKISLEFIINVRYRNKDLIIDQEIRNSYERAHNVLNFPLNYKLLYFFSMNTKT